jgi:hypothetical protein
LQSDFYGSKRPAFLAQSREKSLAFSEIWRSFMLLAYTATGNQKLHPQQNQTMSPADKTTAAVTTDCPELRLTCLFCGETAILSGR